MNTDLSQSFQNVVKANEVLAFFSSHSARAGPLTKYASPCAQSLGNVDPRERYSSFSSRDCNCLTPSALTAFCDNRFAVGCLYHCISFPGLQRLLVACAYMHKVFSRTKHKVLRHGQSMSTYQ